MLAASIVGGFGIEAAAVAEIKIIAEMFGGLAAEVGLPWDAAVSILAATRLTGSMYPTTNFAGQLGAAQCDNTKGGPSGLLGQCGLCVGVCRGLLLIGPMIL